MRVEVSFSSEFAYLKLVRMLVHEICASRTSDMAEIAWMVQAVDEAVSNSIRHAYGVDPSQAVLRVGDEQAIRIECRLDGPQVEMRVSDRGKAFDYEAVERAAKAGAPPGENGGFGLRFVRRIADSVEYTSQNGTNTLIMRRRLRGVRAA